MRFLVDQNLSTRSAKSRSDTPRSRPAPIVISRAALVFLARVGAGFTRPEYRRESA